MARGSIYDNSARRADYLTRRPKNDLPKAIVTTDRSRRQTHGRETTGLETPALTVTANRTDRRNNSVQSITQPVWTTNNSVWVKPGQKADNTFYTTHENNGIIGKSKTYPTIGDIDSAIKEKENQIAGAHKDQYSAMLAGDKLAAKTAGMKIDQLNGESESLMQDKADALGIGKWGSKSQLGSSGGVIGKARDIVADTVENAVGGKTTGVLGSVGKALGNSIRNAGSESNTNLWGNAQEDNALTAFYQTLRDGNAEKPKVEDKAEWWKPASEEKAEWWKPAEDGIKPVSMEKAASPKAEMKPTGVVHDSGLLRNLDVSGGNVQDGTENGRVKGLTPNGEAMQDTGIQTTEELAQEQEESRKRLQELLSANGCINADGILNEEKIALLANPFTGGEAGVAFRNEMTRFEEFGVNLTQSELNDLAEVVDNPAMQYIIENVLDNSETITREVTEVNADVQQGIHDENKAYDEDAEALFEAYARFGSAAIKGVGLLAGGGGKAASYVIAKVLPNLFSSGNEEAPLVDEGNYNVYTTNYYDFGILGMGTTHHNVFILTEIEDGSPKDPPHVYVFDHIIDTPWDPLEGSGLPSKNNLYYEYKE